MINDNKNFILAIVLSMAIIFGRSQSSQTLREPVYAERTRTMRREL